MNSATVVKVTATHEGLLVRLWIDDERGQHLAIAETFVKAHVLATWWVQVREEQDRYQQPPLEFDV